MAFIKSDPEGRFVFRSTRNRLRLVEYPARRGSVHEKPCTWHDHLTICFQDAEFRTDNAALRDILLARHDCGTRFSLDPPE